MAMKIFPALPGTVYTAPVGTSFNRIDEHPTSIWEKLVDKTRVGDDGISVMRTVESYDPVTGGSAGMVDSLLVGVAQSAHFMGYGLDDEALQKVLQLSAAQSIAAASNVPGEIAYHFYQDIGQFPRYAVMIYFDKQSPLFQGGNVVVTFPVAVLRGEQNFEFKKNGLAQTTIEIMAIEDDTATLARDRFGALRIQNAAAA